jgi:hypothetical protein
MVKQVLGCTVKTMHSCFAAQQALGSLIAFFQKFFVALNAKAYCCDSFVLCSHRAVYVSRSPEDFCSDQPALTIRLPFFWDFLHYIRQQLNRHSIFWDRTLELHLPEPNISSCSLEKVYYVLTWHDSFVLCNHRVLKFPEDFCSRQIYLNYSIAFLPSFNKNVP